MDRGGPDVQRSNRSLAGLRQRDVYQCLGDDQFDDRGDRRPLLAGGGNPDEQPADGRCHEPVGPDDDRFRATAVSSFTVYQTPEPSTLVMLAAAAAVLGLRDWPDG